MGKCIVYLLLIGNEDFWVPVEDEKKKELVGKSMFFKTENIPPAIIPGMTIYAGRFGAQIKINHSSEYPIEWWDNEMTLVVPVEPDPEGNGLYPELMEDMIENGWELCDDYNPATPKPINV